MTAPAVMLYKGYHAPRDDGSFIPDFELQYIGFAPIPVVLIDQDDEFYYAAPPDDICTMPSGRCRYPKLLWVAEART